MTDREIMLIERAQKGDRTAFQLLLEEHYDMIYRVAYRFTGQKQDAEDVAQEVCVNLARKLASFRGDSGFSTWLYRVVVNTCRDYFKKQHSSRTIQHQYTELENAHLAESAEAARKVAWLYRAIATLDVSLRETALLVLTEEISHAEAGKILGCTESTISWRMHEIRKRLKTLWDTGYDR